MAESAPPGGSALPAAEITVRYYAAARAAAGVVSESLPLPAEATVDSVVATLARTRPALAAVLPRCSFLLDEVAVRDHQQPVPAGCTVDVLPPFAGG